MLRIWNDEAMTKITQHLIKSGRTPGAENVDSAPQRRREHRRDLAVRQVIAAAAKRPPRAIICLLLSRSFLMATSDSRFTRGFGLTIFR
jgi:hypothetical protein